MSLLNTSRTVVAEYASKEQRADIYQSEADLEKKFINNLKEQEYEYVDIKNEAALIDNLRVQIQKVNKYNFNDNEWKQFFEQYIANKNEDIEEKTSRIQEESRINLTMEDGTTRNIILLDKQNIHNNILQVINQYEENAGAHNSRYDVTILVNGFPMIHVELKRRGIAIREAFNQIKRYQRDSFWASSGLYEYIQIFVISNGTHTRYYSNTTRDSHIRGLRESSTRNNKSTSGSFELTSYWADAKNNIIADLVDFTRTFFAKHTLLNILTKFCVYTSDKRLLVMRPYQISAAEAILQRLEIAHNNKWAGDIKAGGYIWHTTGSGKTLTSFKAAQLASKLDYINKVLFVVDRNDLDIQTMEEYDKYGKDSANHSTSVKILSQQLNDETSKIIITTIQKLGIFIKNNKKHKIYDKDVVFIFDECHRSQFGVLHNSIINTFKKYYLFGFTGTPIFAENSSAARYKFKTTEEIFGEQLHTYTIVNAINDGNVLPFRIDYINTISMADNIQNKEIKSIDEKVFSAPERIQHVVKYILDHFDQKTKRNSFYTLEDGKRIAGFNSILAVSSISMAKLYYNEFQKQLRESNRNLTIATIFSINPNEADPEEAIENEFFDTENLNQSSREFLEKVIADYNQTVKPLSKELFNNYYIQLSKGMKERKVDLLIVVNMFLTGFDAKTLNTLWVDKNLKYHSLIQAYSRTNRPLNSVKTFGNIVCFRNLQEATDEAIALFGDENAKGIMLLKTYNEYYYGYDENKKNGKIIHSKGYKELIDELRTEYPIEKNIVGEEKEKSFIALFGSILRMQNILTAFDEFNGNELLTDRDLQDYKSIYLDLYQKYNNRDQEEKENITTDVIFEIELIRQVEVNIDYILMLVEKYRTSNEEDKTIVYKNITSAINSSIKLRSKKELIESFVDNKSYSDSVIDDWNKFINDKKNNELNQLIKDNNLKPEETINYINNAFNDGEFRTIGIGIQNILPPSNPFEDGNNIKKDKIINNIKNFFDKYYGLTTNTYQ